MEIAHGNININHNPKSFKFKLKRPLITVSSYQSRKSRGKDLYLTVLPITENNLYYK